MARKVNKKFVAILVAGLVCLLIVAGGGLLYWRHKHDPRRTVAAAEAFEKQGDYLDAADYYANAAVRMHDPKIWVAAGNNFNKLLYSDGENVKKMMGCYDGALGLDPNYLPALEAKLTYFTEGMKYLPEFHSPGAYDTIRDLAQKILQADPSNKAAKIAGPISVIDGFQNKFDTDPVKVNDAIKKLQEQQSKDPTNADIPYYMAVAYEGLAAGATRDGKSADADKDNAQALAVMEPAVKAQDNSAAFHYRAAQVYIRQIQIGMGDAKSQGFVDRAKAEIKRAGELVQPTDPQFAEIKLFQGYLIQHGGGDTSGQEKMDQTVKLYQDALAADPAGLSIRVRLAEMLGDLSSRRDDAIELLKDIPPATVEQQSGPRGLAQHGMEMEALASLTNLRLDKYFTLQSESEKQVLLGQIEKDYRKVEVKGETTPAVLRLKAKLQLARNEPGDAIMILDQAIAKTDARDPMRYELMFLEARACLQTDQPGIAKKNLQQIVTFSPNFAPARILLAQTQLKEFDYDGAKDNVQWLLKNQPNNPEAVRMQIALLAHDNKPDEMKKLYTTLPEQNRAQKMDKAGIAAVMNLPDEPRRLLQSVLTADPGDIEAVLMLAQFDLRNKDSAGASAVVDAALKVKPTNPDLLLTKAHLNGSSPEDIRKIQMQEAQNIPDTLERELRLFDLTRGDKDESIPLGHLAAAEKANPNDLRVLNLRFDYSLIIRKWDQAAIYADKLAKVDADKVQGNLYQWRIAMAQAGSETEKDKAVADVNRAHEIAVKLTHDYPVYARSWVCMAQTLQALRQYQEAIGAYQEAKQRQPESVETYQGIIECYYALNQPTDAGKTIAEAVDRMPMYPGFKELQMQHEMKYGDPEKVVAAREKMVADAPDVPQNWKSLAATYESVALTKANAGKKSDADGWFEKARSTLAQAAQKFPGDLSFVAEHGVICVRQNQFDQGEKLWLTAMALPQFKDKPRPTEAFANFYIRGGKPAQAEKVMRDYLATAAGKNDPDLTQDLCNLLADQGKIDAAIAVLDTIPGNALLQTRKVQLLITQQKYADAEKLINVQMQSGKTPELLSSLGFVYLNSNRAKQALDVLNQALVAAPKYPIALYYRALAEQATGGNVDNILSDLTTVRNSAPGMYNARYSLVGELLAAGRRDAAVKELEAILRDDPSQKAAHIQLLALYSQPPSPQWIDAERIAKDADANPDLANDLDIKIAEAQMWSARGMSQKAIDLLQKPLADQPNNLYVLQTYYNILLKADRYQQVLDDTDKLSGDAKDQPWVHSLRGMSKTKLGDKDGGTAEFNTALAQCIKKNDNNTAARICDQIVDSAGVNTALQIVSALPQASEPFWQFETAQFYFKKNQIPDARKAIDNVMTNIAKLPKEQQAQVLGFAGSLYMQTPDPDYAKARDIYLQMLHLTPEDYRIYNNLACNVAVSPSDSLDYSHKAYDLMTKTENYDPLVADTYGWNLVQNANNGVDPGITVLLDAWKARQIVDIAYHLGAAYLKKGNPDEANKYLAQAQSLFNDELKNNTVTDTTLQQKIIDAQRQANDRKAKTGA